MPSAAQASSGLRSRCLTGRARALRRSVAKTCRTVAAASCSFMQMRAAACSAASGGREPAGRTETPAGRRKQTTGSRVRSRALSSDCSRARSSAQPPKPLHRSPLSRVQLPLTASVQHLHTTERRLRPAMHWRPRPDHRPDRRPDRRPAWLAAGGALQGGQHDADAGGDACRPLAAAA